ncbi:MAG: NADH-ubiquinone oxidoreductase-F iron-sulfur binding region domain-containing protein [Actinomycetota bacterium]|nr:NADH-ubiquinone oxidoreductase-F iron-sulfur binding region domain-containing protein [Actinomycetota bacterium]
MTTLYVPRDSAARSVGADEVAGRLAGLLPDATIVRTGSRGALWLEPLVEVDTPGGRLGYGPVTPQDAESVAAAISAGTGHALELGLVDDLPWLADQHRLLFARSGLADPLDADAYIALGGLRALRAAVAMDPLAVVAAVEASGLRGRGGAGFPAGIKWRTVAAAEADRKYVCINADEGDSGTFADRLLMEGDPFTLIEGAAVAGLAVGATQGYAYIRSEYPDAVATMRDAVAEARHRGWLGPSVLGGGRGFDLAVRVGAGSYVCGEETAMLESLEGRRGMVRAKPPIPALAGLHGRPTLVHNVLTLASVVSILGDGADAYAALGRDRSRGTQVFQLAGNIARGGIVELPFGPTLRELVEGYGGGTRSGRPVRAVQLGGPLGAYLPASRLDVAMDYESVSEAGGMLGHGGIVVFDDTVDMAEQARFAMEFCAEESCGKCTPCRIGAVRGVEVVDRLRAGGDPDGDREVLLDLCEVMRDGSLCAMGGLTPQPVLSALEHFGEDFIPRTAVGA